MTSNSSKQFKSITEQMVYFRNRLESLQESAIIIEQNDLLLEALLAESSLSKLIGSAPGGQSLVRFLHKKYRLANDAEYEEIPARLHAEGIKANKDNFAIIVGTNGVAGIKPVDADWDRAVADVRNPSKDRTMRYIVVWSANNEPIETEVHKYRLGRRDASGGTSGMEGGAPNLFQVLKGRIGSTTTIYTAVGAIERGKMQARQVAQSKGPVPTDPEIFSKIQPVMLKLLNQAISNIGPKITQYAQAGNYGAIKSLTDAGEELKKILTILDSSKPNWDDPALRSLRNAVKTAIEEITSDLEGSSKEEILRNIASGQAQELGNLLTNVRSQLMKLKPSA